MLQADEKSVDVLDWRSTQDTRDKLPRFPSRRRDRSDPATPSGDEQGILVIQSSNGGRHGETVDCKCSELWKAKRVGDIPKFI